MADLARDRPDGRPDASATAADPGRAAPIQRIARDGDRFSRQGVKAIGLERAPHKDVYHFILGRTWPTFFLIVALVFVLANVLFAWLYLAEPGAVANVRPGSFEDAFYFSVQTLATIGYGWMYPASRYGHVVVALEAVVGILMVALITGITFTRFARPIARVLFSNKAVVTPRDGVPHLMFRMANWRRNIRCGTPSRGVTTALFENSTRAIGRAKRVKVMPVMRATIRMPTTASSATTTWP